MGSPGVSLYQLYIKAMPENPSLTSTQPYDRVPIALNSIKITIKKKQG